VVVVEVESQSMTYLVPFVYIEIKSKDPDVKDEDADTSPAGEVTSEDRIVFDLQTLVQNDEDEGSKHDDGCPNSKP
jgi:hypothetical protein